MDARSEFFRLKEQWKKAKGADRERADREMETFFNALTEEEKEQVNRAVNEDFDRMHRETEACRLLAKQIKVRQQLEAVLPFISVSKFAQEYFGKSASWLHQRINGNAVHGKAAEFTPAELQTLANALKDVAVKLECAAMAL